MADLIPTGLVFVGLLAVYAILLPGRRADRGNWKDPISGLGRPDGALLTWFLGGLAVITVLEVVSGDAPSMAVATGILLGVSAPWVRSRVAGSALDLIGVVAALIALVLFVGGSTPGTTASDPALSGPLRLLLGSALLVSFVGGIGVGLLIIPSRSVRSFSFVKGRGLVFFGLVDVVTWLVSPLGVDLSLLSMGERFQYGAAGLLFTFVLGVAAGQFTLVVAALGVGMVSVLAPAAGMAPMTPALPFAVGFAVGAVLSSALRGIVRHR